ncbi:hypothetical protein Tco_1254364 [Tanacetum coccineum]
MLRSTVKAKNVSIGKLKEHLFATILSPLHKRIIWLHIKTNLKHTQENADILCEIVEHVRELRPLDSDLASACTFVTRIQELLVYVTATCPSSKHDKSSSLKASGSKPKSNTKKDKILQTSSSNKENNKVEDQPRIAKSSLNNMNRVSKTVCNENVKPSVLNANSELICATWHECMFDDIHDLCVSDYLNDVHSRVKSKSVKSRSAKSKKKKNVETYWSGAQLLVHCSQFCDSDLEVAFRKHTCYVWNLDGADLLSGSRDINLYTISLNDILKSSQICLLSKASKNKSWLWHRRYRHQCENHPNTPLELLGNDIESSITQLMEILLDQSPQESNIR